MVLCYNHDNYANVILFFHFFCIYFLYPLS